MAGNLNNILVIDADGHVTRAISTLRRACRESRVLGLRVESKTIGAIRGPFWKGRIWPMIEGPGPGEERTLGELSASFCFLVSPRWRDGGLGSLSGKAEIRASFPSASSCRAMLQSASQTAAAPGSHTDRGRTDSCDT